MKRITIIDGHPEPSERRLVHALADRYAEVARAVGNEVRRIDVARIDFPLLRNPDDFMNGAPPPTIVQAQQDIAWADHLVFFYPMWIFDMPALLKGFVEQTFRPGFAMGSGGKRRPPKQLLTGKSARLVITMGMPAPMYRWYMGEHMVKSYARALNMCGVNPVEQTLIGGVGEASARTVKKWFDEMTAIAERDSKPLARKRVRPVRRAARTAVLFAGTYLAYVSATWMRYGRNKDKTSQDSLLDRAMPDYEVTVRHRIAVHAPAQTTFDVIRSTDFERSPIVRALFRTREMLFHAKHAEQPMPHALMEQLRAIGWTVLAEEDGREIVLGTVTQPWHPNPVFRSLSPNEFATFSEPRFAKIVVTLRVDPLSAELCEASTETRVQTTDSASHSLFRSYWAFLSPGIDLIRRVLLQQIKAEAEDQFAVKRIEGEISSITR